MRNFNLAVLSLLSLVAVTVPSSRAATIYTTTLRGTNEVPANTSTAIGSAIVTLNGDLLTVNETYSGITGAPTGAHIHCCSAIGTNSPVAIPFTAFPTTVSGTYNQTFDLTQAATYNAPFLATFANVAAAEVAVINGLNTGQTYANIHDAAFTGGEIRGQLAAVPEPTTMALMMLGLIPAIGMARRRGYLRFPTIR